MYKKIPLLILCLGVYSSAKCMLEDGRVMTPYGPVKVKKKKQKKKELRKKIAVLEQQLQDQEDEMNELREKLAKFEQGPEKIIYDQISHLTSILTDEKKKTTSEDRASAEAVLEENAALKEKLAKAEKKIAKLKKKKSGKKRAKEKNHPPYLPY